MFYLSAFVKSFIWLLIFGLFCKDLSFTWHGIVQFCLHNKYHIKSPAGLILSGSCGTIIQLLLVRVYPHGNFAVAKAGFCEEFRSLDALFLLLFSQVLWPLGIFLTNLHVKSPHRPVFSTTEGNKTQRQLNLENLPFAEPLFWRASLLASHSSRFSTLYSQTHNTMCVFFLKDFPQSHIYFYFIFFIFIILIFIL